MWDDARQMNALALTLTALSVLALVASGLAWLVRQQVFALRDVVVAGSLERTNASYLEAVIREDLTGTFFTMDLDRARKSLTQVPWIRGVSLRRQWPQRLEVTVDEHVPFARWNQGTLVNTHGETFSAQWSAELPSFEGAEGRAAEVTARYRAWSAALAALGYALSEIRQSPRGGWRLRASGLAGPLTLELGRDEPDARLARFVSAHARTLSALARAGTRVEAVDLRYRNGFAARVPGFREMPRKPGA